MSDLRLVYKVYYLLNLRRCIPRNVQIWLRRCLLNFQLRRSKRSWPINEEAGSKPFDWGGWPDGKKFAFVLQHDVESSMGLTNIDSVIELEESLGFSSSFNFVPEKYTVPVFMRDNLKKRGFEIGVHGLNHDGKLFSNKRLFLKRASRINNYLREWDSIGFSSPCSMRNLSWMQNLNVLYARCTFDTDPFEPQPKGAKTIFPFFVRDLEGGKGYVEMPYTLPQDFTLFILMEEKVIDIWKTKLDWIANKGGMALLNTHPDYMLFKDSDKHRDRNKNYPAELYEKFLQYAKEKYGGRYWHALPAEMASFWKQCCVSGKGP